jgi:hypothetical protein
MGKPGPQCQVCKHKARAQIELALVHRIGTRVIAERFGLHKDAVLRHSNNHLSALQRAALLANAKALSPVELDAMRTSESEGLLASLISQRARLSTMADAAMALQDIKAAVAAENSIQGNLTIVAKLLGQLAVQHNVTHTSILISSDYLALRSAIVTALRPYPHAARAVGEALHALEAQAAKDLTAATSGGPHKAEPMLIEATADKFNEPDLNLTAPELPPLPPLPPLPGPPCT